MVHGLDIFRALGITRQLPAAHSNVALGMLVSPKGAKALGLNGSLDGIRVEASDTGWSHGSGVAVSAPADDLVLALGGRPNGREALTGPGADELRRRLAA